jgi:hypothetical protein
MEKKESIGALWCRNSKSGIPFMSGMVTIGGVETRLVMFANKKAKPEHPDWKIYISEPLQKQADDRAF